MNTDEIAYKRGYNHGWLYCIQDLQKQLEAMNGFVHFDLRKWRAGDPSKRVNGPTFFSQAPSPKAPPKAQLAKARPPKLAIDDSHTITLEHHKIFGSVLQDMRAITQEAMCMGAAKDVRTYAKLLRTINTTRLEFERILYKTHPEQATTFVYYGKPADQE